MPISWSSAPRYRGFMYGGLAALMLFHLAVLYMVLHPTVSDSYFAYFISRSSDCLTRPVDGGIAPGTMASLVQGSADPARVIVCGMAAPEAQGTWTVGRNAALLMPATGANDQDLVLEIVGVFLPSAGYVQHISASSGGVLIGTATLDAAQPRTIRLPLKQVAATADGKLRIDLALPDAASPLERGLGNDSRRLGVMVRAAGIVPHGPSRSSATTTSTTGNASSCSSSACPAIDPRQMQPPPAN